jgi:cobalt-zinc-cadmium efflux system membrane fusion protein
VIEKHITLGEAVGREVPAFVIADLSSVWVDLTVYQRDLARIGVGKPVEVYVGHELGGKGTITYVTPVVSEKTRTATARVVLDNQQGQWRPGMFVTGSIVVERETVAVVVARTALHSFEGRAVVFLETHEGFVPQPVTIGRMDAASAQVLEGLSPGDRYVIVGGFTLKAELGKESFGEGHAH